MNTYSLPNRPSIRHDLSLHHKADVFSMRITYLGIIGAPDNGATFHFRLYLISQTRQNSSEAVRIDARPAASIPESVSNVPSPMHAIAMLQFRSYKYSDGAGPKFFADVTPGTTLEQLLTAIFDKHKLDQYIFREPGVGCRHWCATVLDRLAQEGLVHSGVPRMFLDNEFEANQEYGSSAYPMPRIKGHFYE